MGPDPTVDRLFPVPTTTWLVFTPWSAAPPLVVGGLTSLIDRYVGGAASDAESTDQGTAPVAHWSVSPLDAAARRSLASASSLLTCTVGLTVQADDLSLIHI